MPKMDRLDKNDGKHNADEIQAMRLVDLATDFTNAQHPLSVRHIKQAHYPDKASWEAFEKAFYRDRKALTLLGIFLKKSDVDIEDGGWELDAEKTLVGEVCLTNREASLLSIAARSLVDDSSFPYRDELLVALAKIRRSFNEPLPGKTISSPVVSAQLRELRTCFNEQKVVGIHYADAKGKESIRDIAIYGFFGFREQVYAVAASVENGQTTPAICRYRIDRISKVTPRKTAYKIPSDFNINDWRLLPFQIGDERSEQGAAGRTEPAAGLAKRNAAKPVVARFEVPHEYEHDVRHETLGRGTWAQHGDKLMWEVDVVNYSAAASWAIALGITPLSPQELCDEWRLLLEGVLAHG